MDMQVPTWGGVGVVDHAQHVAADPQRQIRR